MRPDTLASSIVILLAVNVVQRTIGFGRGVLFCRWLEPEELGHWEMAYSFLLLAAPLAVLGLPGSFGRYAGRFHEQGQLQTFLRRTGFWTLALSSAAVGGVLLNQRFFAQLVFGSEEQRWLLLVTAGCLAAVILHHFLEAVFAGLKLFRVVSAMHFCQSMVFAATALTLVAQWRADAVSIVIGYATGCAVSATGVIVWSLVRRSFSRDAATSAVLPHRDFWPPLLRFAIGVWIANLFCNLFAVVDRYMILHCGGFGSELALVQIGNYHTSCIVPFLLVSVASLMTGALTPHLSQDWERGDRRLVSDRLNRALQLVSLTMLAAGACVLWFCPWLFRVAFDQKYAAGLAVLPLTTASCVWFSLLLVAQTYAWCAERTRAAAFPLAIGLVVNVALNLLWLPTWGLAGAVAATATATMVALYLQLAVNYRLGMQLSPVTLALCAAPLALVGGAATALCTVVAVSAAVWLLSARPTYASFLDDLKKSQPPTGVGG